MRASESVLSPVQGDSGESEGFARAQTNRDHVANMCYESAQGCGRGRGS
jgi:hypothetical protein